MTHAIKTRILTFCLSVLPTGMVFSLLLLFPVLGLGQTPSFSTHSFSSAAGNSLALHGDLNNDGYEDLVISTKSGASRVYLSKGNGSYTALAASISASPQLLGDFNGDGKLDLIAGNHMYLGNGNGTFRSAGAIALLATSTNIAAADVNHDGKLDLLMLTAPYDNENDSYVQVLLGNGEGGFTAGTEVTVYENYGTTQLLTGDFNGDGNADVAVATQQENAGNEATINVFSGDGAGNLSQMFQDVSLDQLNDLSAADVNGDGISDLVSTGVVFDQGAPFIDHELWVYYGQSNGNMLSTEIPLANFGVGQVTVADFNGDGISDIAVFETDCGNDIFDNCTITSAATLNVLSGTGNGGFALDAPVSSLQSNPGSLLALRGNRDTKADLVFTNPTTSNTPITMLLNTAAGNFPACAAPNAAVGIAQCSPTAGSTVNSPVSFAIGAAATQPIRKIELWADGKKQLEQFAGAFSNYGFLNASLPLAAGSHKINIITAGWDNSQQSNVSTITVKASPSCSAPTSAGVHICSPTSGSTVSSPVKVQAAAKVTGTIASTQLWVDGVKKVTSAGSTTLTTTVSLAAGSHRFAVIATNTVGQKWESTVNATVK
jgi:FG-GAP-like repeat/Bacterial Ig domain/FG-GAP repeat